MGEHGHTDFTYGHILMFEQYQQHPEKQVSNYEVLVNPYDSSQLQRHPP